MKKIKFLNKRMLMKNTTLMISIFVAAVLIFSSAVSSITIKTNNVNMDVESNLVLSEASPGRTPDSHISSYSQAQQTDRDDWLYFHSGFNNNGVGFDGPIVFEMAMRLTPAELGAYDGYDLTTVKWYHYDTVACTDVVIKIYDEGTDTTAGPLITSEAYTVSTVGWYELELTSPVTVDASKDIWVSIEFDQTAAGFPGGVDAGPQIVDKGGFIYYSGAWDQLYILGLNYNWCIEAMVAEYVAPLEHDVGVTSINSPETGPAGVITPEVTVENLGNNSESDVPVNMKIGKMLPPSTVFSEGFEDYIPSVPIFPPLGWSIQSTSTSTWYKYSTGYARCSEDNTGAQDEWLITETFDCSSLTVVGISMYFYMATPNDDYVEILGSTDNGATWDNMIVNITGYMASAIRSYDITSWAAGESQVKIAWRWVSSDTATGSDYFQFRQFKIGSPSYVTTGVSEDFNGAWGTYGNNPPAGWDILDFGSESPPVWNNNDWYRILYSTFGSYCARVYYSPYEQMDEWLITPTIDCSALTDVDLSFRQYFYFSTSYPGYGYIEGSIDNGTTWTEVVATYGSTQSTNYYSYDISSWAAGQSQVKLAFHYVSTGTHGYYWYVDDVMAGSIVDEIVLFENYWFNDMTPDDWGPNGWMQEEVDTTTDTDPNIWRGADDTYLTTPAVDPYAGDYMAIYDTGLLFPNGASARLYTPAADWSVYGATVLRLKFMIYISNYGSTYTDRCDVQISTDGSTWTTLESIDTYDASNPGWVEKTIDLIDYASETSVRLGFLGVDGGYRDIIIDDVLIEAALTDIEYDETILVDIPVKDETVIFPDWTPDDWQVSENVDIDYAVTATTMLPGDEDPDNDEKSGTITLSYPYLHDIAVIGIDDPNSGPAQTLPVEVTIKNIGQFEECCYKTNVQIGGWIPTGPPTETTYDFESNDGGFVPTATWDPIGDWEWTDSYDYSLYTGTNDPPPTAYSGDGLWATVPHGDYTNSGGSTFLTKTIDLSGVTDAEISFYEWHDTWGAWDWLAVNVNGVQEWFHDGSTPSTSWQLLTIDLDDYTGQSGVEIVFELYATTVVAYSGWYIDNVTIIDVETELVPEYDEEICTIILEPGEEATLTFPDWTPDALADGISGPISYGVIAEQQLPGDTNPANDILSETITLDYWHDVGIQEITSPSMGRKGDVIFEQLPHDPDDAWSIGTSDAVLGYKMYENFWDLTDPIGDVHWWGLCLYWTGTGWIAGDPTNMVFDIGFYEDDAGYPGAEVDYFADVTCTYVGTGLIYAGFEMQYWSCDDLGDSVSLSDGFVSIQGTQTTGDCFLWHSAKTGDGFSYQEGGAPPETIYDRAMQLTEGTGGGPGPPGVDIYIASGSQAIGAIVENLGTFGETGLTCYAEIYEFITNETVGTLDWEANVIGIDLDPLGGEETLAFGSYGFADEGVYALELHLPLTGDDDDGNNEETLGIGVDDTAPTSGHTVDPATPDGENGWYVSDVTVSFTATDALSGVDHIEYRVNGGITITGDSVVVSEDGEHTVEYRAVDNVGNEESWNSVDFKIDQTIPTVDLTWEADGSGTDWQVTFTATCSDATSGMNRVEFFIGNELQFTDTAAPYEWIIDWSSALEGVTFYAYAYDDAGLENVDDIDGGNIEAVPVPQGQTTPTPVTQKTNSL